MTDPKRNSSVSSAEAIAGNEDLLSEILIRLPARSLVAFKCVSSRWRSFISDPTFARRHTLLHANSRPSALFLRASRSPSGLLQSDMVFVPLSGSPSRLPPFTSLDFVRDRGGIKILQSSNGLFLCSTSHKTGITCNHYVYNPATKKYFKLPRVIGNRGSMEIRGLALVFEPTKSVDYIVVCVRNSLESPHFYQILVYSSNTRAWRVSGSPFVAPSDMLFANGIPWNGAVYWASKTGASLCFDIEQECVRTMPSLMHSRCKTMFTYLGESCGHLNLIEMSGARSTEFKIFRMEKNCCTWFIKYQVDLKSITAVFPDIVRDYLDPRDLRYYAFSLLSLVDDDVNEEESALLLNIPGKVVAYRLKDKTFDKVCDLVPYGNHQSLHYGWLDAYQYTESLACV